MPIIEEAALQYTNTTGSATQFVFTTSKSSEAFTSLNQGNADIALASDLEEYNLQNNPQFSKFNKQIIGRTAVVVIVNSENPVTSLSLDQIARIFRGDITNWKDIGGPDISIVTVGRRERTLITGEGSGARSIFYRKVLHMDESEVQARQEVDSDDEVVTFVSENPNAIGYAYYWYVEPEHRKAFFQDTELIQYQIKALSILQNEVAVQPSTSTISDGSYPIYENLNVYTRTDAKPAVNSFSQFLLSPYGQNIVDNRKQVPIYTFYGISMELNGPTNITMPGHYRLGSDILRCRDRVCIWIQTSNVVFDGMGHSIISESEKFDVISEENFDAELGRYPDKSNCGILVKYSSNTHSLCNVTVKNVTVKNWNYGIQYLNHQNGEIRDVTAEDNSKGIYALWVADFQIQNATLRNNVDGGLRFQDCSRGAIKECKIITDDGRDIESYDGLHAMYCEGFSIQSNYLVNNYKGIVIYGVPDAYAGQTPISKSKNFVIENNTIENTLESGLVLINVKDTVIAYNTIKNATTGVSLENCGSNITMFSNYFINTAHEVVTTSFDVGPAVLAGTILLALSKAWNAGTGFISDYIQSLAHRRRHGPLMGKTGFLSVFPPAVSGCINNSTAVSILGSAILGYAFYTSYHKILEPSALLYFVIVAGIVIVAHEMAHYLFAKRFNISAKYHLWTWGILITIITGVFLKNVFGQPIFTVIDNEDKCDKRDLGIVMLAGPVTSLLLSTVFLLMIHVGGELAEIAWIGLEMSILTALISFMPIDPMDGYRVFKWRKSLWLAFFIPLLAIYLILFAQVLDLLGLGTHLTP